MSDVQAHRFVDSASSQQPSKLLQLAEANRSVLDLMLQKLNNGHLASLAASCSKLSDTIPEVITQITLNCRDPDAVALASLSLWLERHNSSSRLIKLTDCSVFCTSAPNWSSPKLDRLPCTHLRHLKLRNMFLQLEPADGCPGVLHGCKGLTALDLERCTVNDPMAAFAAIAALPELQHLRLVSLSDEQEGFYFGEFQRPLKLTYLEVDPCVVEPVPFTAECLAQLPALVNLEHLDLQDLASELPGGLPSQLVKLTCLRVHYDCQCHVAEQFQHLSTFTALQRPGFGCDWHNVAVAVPDVSHLSQLTSLELASSELEFSTSSTSGLASLTALHELDLKYCSVQPAAVAALTQLRALKLERVHTLGAATCEEVLLAVAKLTLLTELQYFEGTRPMVPPPPAAAFSALTASTNLCSLKVFFDEHGIQDRVLFSPSGVNPHLRSIDLGTSTTGEQQLQHLCSCCPAVESLALQLSETASSTACLPLLQLSALTQLQMCVYLDRAAAGAGMVNVAAQLTGLKQLVLDGPWQEDRTVLLQLTALTTLQKLELAMLDAGHNTTLCFRSKARWCNPPDVWMQLLRHLLRDVDCRQALLKRSPAAAAAPAQLMLAQLAATLVEELAGLGPLPIRRL